MQLTRSSRGRTRLSSQPLKLARARAHLQLAALITLYLQGGSGTAQAWVQHSSLERTRDLSTARRTLEAWDLQSGDHFGFSLAVRGEHLLAGLPYDDLAGTRSGSVAAFVRHGEEWQQRDILAPPGATTGDYFGMALALGQDECVVGAPWDSGLAPRAGAVHLYRWDGRLWHHLDELHQPHPSEGAQLGEAVALEGSLLVAGARHQIRDGEPTGSAYLWRKSGDGWELEATLVGSECEADAQFGFRVATAGGRVFVAAHGEEAGSGAVYVFEQEPTSWVQAHRIQAPEPSEGDYFGLALTANRGQLVVGAPWKDSVGEDAGEAFIYALEPTGWRLKERLSQPGTVAFASIMDLGPGGLVIGARGSSQPSAAPGLSLYHAPAQGGGLGPLRRLSSRANRANRVFCRSIAVDRAWVVVGSEREGETATSPGEVTLLPLERP